VTKVCKTSVHSDWRAGGWRRAMAGMDQMTSGLEPLLKKTRKEVFFDEMNQLVPWAALVAWIQPHTRGARQALGSTSA